MLFTTKILSCDIDMVECYVNLLRSIFNKGVLYG